MLENPLVIIFGVGSILVYLWWSYEKTQNPSRDDGYTGAIDSFYIGRYLVGLPNVDGSQDIRQCIVTSTDFAFVDKYARELGSIPRSSVNQVFFDVRSQITQRITATRILALGIFSLAAPKQEKHQEFCLVIDWKDANEVHQNTIFEFSGRSGQIWANRAASKLTSYVSTKLKKERANDKRRCPNCDELISVRAKICRFCRSELESYDLARST